jgi:hypothetical protein
MKALSIRQPWAWLILHGGKDIENREWPTMYRGPFWIHASSHFTRADYEACALFIAGMRTEWRLPAYDILRGRTGGIVGRAELARCVTGSESPWFCGPFGFVIRNPQPTNFIPCKGRLKFFTVPECGV